MGRGKQWNDMETKALIEAFIHISEDSIVGTNQSAEKLFERVTIEAKKRYPGDWMRSAHASKKRWQDVSREVQKFCAAMKFVTSVEHSGWNDDDYFKAAEEYYCQRGGAEVTKFKFVDEWNFLKSYEKWKTAVAPVEKRKIEQASPLSSDISDSDSKSTPRPIGNKKAKALAALESKADEWMEKIAGASNAQDNSQAMLDMIRENMEQSQKNREFLQTVFETQTNKLTMQLEKNAALKAAQMQKGVALKALTKMDLSSMSTEFQQKARKKIEEEISSILDF